MTTDQVNVLNCGLMIGACAASFVVPFEVFLFAYAVLGPLHYLTQISWLHSRDYFTTGKHDWLLLAALCAGLLIFKYVVSGFNVVPWATAIVCFAFASAFAMALLTSTVAKVAVVIASLPLAGWLSTLGATQLIFLSLVPTIIHVYVFTAAFILYGALRGRSATGIVSLVVFAACTASFFLWVPAVSRQPLSAYVLSTYALFDGLNLKLAEWLGIASLRDKHDVYASPMGLALMRFIAFAYTYHYLNWFSKTSIIQWHRIPVAWTVANVVLWLGSVALYAWNYQVGVLVLFSLSYTHVLLEFPLDHRTFAGIGRELGALVRPTRA